MSGRNARDGELMQPTSAEQTHTRCTRVHSLPPNNVSLLSKFMESLRVKQDTKIVYQRAASCAGCQPPAWQNHGESHERFLVGQTNMNAAVAEAWHILPLGQQLIAGARILDGTKERDEVSDRAR